MNEAVGIKLIVDGQRLSSLPFSKLFVNRNLIQNVSLKCDF